MKFEGEGIPFIINTIRLGSPLPLIIPFEVKLISTTFHALLRGKVGGINLLKAILSATLPLSLHH